MTTLKREIPMDGIWVRILEHEKGVKFTGLGGVSVLNPGEHMRIPGWTRVVAVNMREQRINREYRVTTKDRSGFDVQVDLRYKVAWPENFAQDAPTDAESRIETIAGAEANKYIQEHLTARDLREQRSPLEISIRTVTHEAIRLWGLEVVNAIVPIVSHVQTPYNATPLEAGQYQLAMDHLLAPLRAQLETNIKTIQAQCNAEALRIEGHAKLDLLQRFGTVISEVGGTLAREFGPDQGANVLYAVLSQCGGSPLLAQRFSTLFSIDTKNEAARRTAHALYTDPLYARLLNDASDIASQFAGGNPSQSLRDMDGESENNFFRNPKKF